MTTARSSKQLLRAAAALTGVTLALQAAPPAQAAPHRDGITTWTSSFPFSGTRGDCVDAQPTTACRWSTTADRSGSIAVSVHWASNPSGPGSKSLGYVYALGEVGGPVFVPNGATQLSVDVDYLVTQPLQASASPWSAAYLDHVIYAFPPGCHAIACAHEAGGAVVSSPLVDEAPPSVAAGTSGRQQLTIAAPVGQSLPKGWWSVRARFSASAVSEQDQPLQEANATGSVDVTRMTTTATSPERRT